MPEVDAFGAPVAGPTAAAFPPAEAPGGARGKAGARTTDARGTAMHGTRFTAHSVPAGLLGEAGIGPGVGGPVAA